MFKPTGFGSWRNYFRYILARKFIPFEKNQEDTFTNANKVLEYQYQTNILEKIGQFISRPIIEPLSFVVKHIQNPLFIIALTITAIALVTIGFYPNYFILVAAKVFPLILKLQPWMIKLGLYCVLLITILGIGIRGLGRVCNEELLKKWHEKKIWVMDLGDKIFLPKKA